MIGTSRTTFAHYCAQVINRGLRPSDLMHLLAIIYMIHCDGGMRHCSKNAPHDSITHSAATGSCNSWHKTLKSVEVGPADAFALRMASICCTSSSRSITADNTFAASCNHYAADSSAAMVDTELKTLPAMAAGTKGSYSQA